MPGKGATAVQDRPLGAAPPRTKACTGGTLGSMLPRLEVHGAVGQVVLAADVADLLGLHGLQLGAVSDAMAQATTERAAPLTCNRREEVRGNCATPGDRPLHLRSRVAAAPGCPLVRDLPQQPGVLSAAQVSQQPCGNSLGHPRFSHLRFPAWSRPRSAAPGAQAAPSASPPGAGPSGPSAPTHLGAEAWISQSPSRGGGAAPQAITPHPCWLRSIPLAKAEAAPLPSCLF